MASRFRRRRRTRPLTTGRSTPRSTERARSGRRCSGSATRRSWGTAVGSRSTRRATGCARTSSSRSSSRRSTRRSSRRATRSSPPSSRPIRTITRSSSARSPSGGPARGPPPGTASTRTTRESSRASTSAATSASGRRRWTTRERRATAMAASMNSAVSFPSGAAVAVPATDPTQSTFLSVPVKLAAGTVGIQSLGFNLTLRDPELISEVTASATLRGNVDEVPASSASDDVESTSTVWGHTASSKLDPSASFERLEVTPFDHRWVSRHRSGTADLSLTSPPLLVSATTSFSFTFRHRYSFYSPVVVPALYPDGGVLEISTDDGATWADIGGFAVPGYPPHVLYDELGALSPLHGRPAWSGNGDDLPAFTSVTVSLGKSYAGKTVRVRFRRGIEFADFPNFWEIDDIAFTGITNTPFPALVADRGRCQGRHLPVGTSGGTVVKKH